MQFQSIALEEDNSIKRYFKDYIRKGILPSEEACIRFIMSTPNEVDRSYLHLSEHYVQDKVKKFIKEASSSSSR